MECQSCAFNAVVQAISTLLQTTTVVIDKKNIPLNAIEYFVNRHKKTNSRVSHAAEALIPSFAKLTAFIEKDLLPKCRDVCLTCARHSDDDNLTHSGQTFVFMEAMPCGAGELASEKMGKDPDGAEEWKEGGESERSAEDRAFFEDDDDETTASQGNWLNTHAVKTGRSTGGSQGVTALPTGIENELRYVLAQFKELSILQQCVLLLRWNEMSFVDIGSMTWVPDEFRRHNDKQLVSFWWKNIVKKFPLADGLTSKNKRKKGKTADETDAEDDYRSHSPSVTYCEQELDFGSSL